MAGSFVGQIREIVQQSSIGIMACTVVKTNPIQLRVKDNADAVIFKESLVIPSHVSLQKGDTAYLTPYAENTYFVLGKGKGK